MNQPWRRITSTKLSLDTVFAAYIPLRGNNPPLSRLEMVAKTLIKEGIEYAFLFDESGKVNDFAIGDQSSVVMLTPKDLKNQIHLHNHPNTTTFSLAERNPNGDIIGDLLFAVTLNYKQ